MLKKSGRKQKLYDEGVHKSNLNSIKNCWEVFRHLATPADSLASRYHGSEDGLSFTYVFHKTT